MRAAALVVLVLALVAAFPATQAGAADPDAGRRKASPCNGCHAQRAMANVPSLGGQTAGYFLSAMRAYQDGVRRHATMRDVAKGLSDRELKDLAAWYARPAPALPDETPVPDTPAVATACEACHGTAGRAPVDEATPVIAGQKRAFLALALTGYRDGSRLHAVMQPVAASLGDGDVEALSAYFAAVPGLSVR